MSLTGKNRKQITDLKQAVQLAELNRQLDWIWQQLLGGLSIKSMDSNTQSSMNQSAVQSGKIDWIIAGGEDADSMVLTPIVMLCIAKDINENGRIAVGAFNSDLAGIFFHSEEDGQTMIDGERVPMLAALEKRVAALEQAEPAEPGESTGGET